MITLIDFYADWCGPCQAIAPVLDKVLKDFEDKVTLEKVDVDKNPEKSSKFGVVSIPTLVITDKEGKELDRKVGGLGETELKAWLQKNLE